MKIGKERVWWFVVACVPGGGVVPLLPSLFLPCVAFVLFASPLLVSGVFRSLSHLIRQIVADISIDSLLVHRTLSDIHDKRSGGPFSDIVS